MLLVVIVDLWCVWTQAKHIDPVGIDDRRVLAMLMFESSAQRE